MRLQSIQSVPITAKFFFPWHKLVDCIVTGPAKRNRLTHLLAREVLLEPLVAVASSRDQVMFGGAAFRLSMTKHTLSHWLTHLLDAFFLDQFVWLL